MSNKKPANATRREREAPKAEYESRSATQTQKALHHERFNHPHPQVRMISNCNKNHIHSINLETAATNLVATRCAAILIFRSQRLAMLIFTHASMTSGASRSITGVRECQDILIAVDQVP